MIVCHETESVASVVVQ